MLRQLRRRRFSLIRHAFHFLSFFAVALFPLMPFFTITLIIIYADYAATLMIC